MWGALLSLGTSLLSGGSNAAASVASGAVALCQQQLADASDISRRMVSQRNAALALVPVAAVAGFWLGRRFK